ncbi:transcriptional regulator, LysR family [Ancylobacter novellus DSM 506]|uniref:Transcriptional regulator, LysR family n=1 Tax=Ancylobacter novellus (strain ATCC 8093 / DSM 506 / JCM 20403 / CCM 1077 / IAM 12100 / NBRC 12443 / NCIMB 10456) TaxID=639283 RepID=D7A540_ANCN5|nr:LysR family transcriptional regulator [Ancylobacter novellus]ADH89928.1 transcriptional regulator, LysR family [Ancylobacter novellus DSM 506]
MRYTLRQLEYFIAAGETGSITLASERISISQPSISTAISHLEQELGVQLFVRHHAQGLSLTPVGRKLLAEAKHLVEQAEGLYAVASEATDQVRGQLSVGCMVTLAPMIIPELSHGFTSAFPDTRIRHVEANQEWLLDGLRRADIDIAITYDLQIPDGITFTPLASLPAHVVVSEAHPFARLSAVSLQELAEQPLILLDLPISSEYFLALFIKEGLEPKIHSRSAHQEVVRTMVANGYGYTLANVRPRSDLALDGRRVVRVGLAGEHRPMVIGTATVDQFKKSRLIQMFEAHCRSFISDAYIPGMVAPAIDRRLKKP